MFEWSGAWGRAALFGGFTAAVMVVVVLVVWSASDRAPTWFTNDPERVVVQFRRQMERGNEHRAQDNFCPDLRPGGRRTDEGDAITVLFRDHQIDLPPRAGPGRETTTDGDTGATPILARRPHDSANNDDGQRWTVHLERDGVVWGICGIEEAN